MTDTSALSPELAAKVDAVRVVIARALEEHGAIVFANSLGAEDIVLTEILGSEFPGVVQFMLDTGRLHEETYRLQQKVEERHQIKLEVYYPNTDAVQTFVRSNGINAFYNSIELRKGCCAVRKVEPLRRALKDRKAWITGLRRQQAVTRADLPVQEWDEGNGLWKLNPLADWTEKDVWAFIKGVGAPYNELHDRFFPSIGCSPCTRAITVGEDVRAGRWWWELPEFKECGLHPGSKSAA
jgi:phosphoadenosine phosphosulfate reductase